MELGKSIPEEKKWVDFTDFSVEQRIKYLRNFWKAASEFYHFTDDPIEDAKVNEAIKGLKSKPRPQVRRVIDLNNWKWKLDEEMKRINSEYFKRDFNDSDWPATSIPHDMESLSPNIHYGIAVKWAVSNSARLPLRLS